MATRNGDSIALVWVLVDLGAPQVNALVRVAETRHRNRVSAELSVNRSADGSRALIKIASTENGFRTALSAAAADSIVRVFTEADHHEALALVTAPEWTGREPESMGA